VSEEFSRNSKKKFTKIKSNEWKYKMKTEKTFEENG